MTIDEIIVGDRVLVQSGEFTREVARVKGVEDGLVIVLFSDGRFADLEPQYIIKSFGQ